MRNFFILTILFLASHTFACNEKLPKYSQEQCLSSINELYSFLKPNEYLYKDPLKNKSSILNSYEPTKKIIIKNQPIILECWIHYKSDGLVEVTSSTDIMYFSYNKNFSKKEDLLQHETMFKIYGRQLLEMLTNIETYINSNPKMSALKCT